MGALAKVLLAVTTVWICISSFVVSDTVARRKFDDAVQIATGALPLPKSAQRVDRGLSDATPAASPAHSKLARDLQSELTRVGCYSGAIDADWNDVAKSAMTAFNVTVNATLSVAKPDHVLLTLVQGHAGRACKPTTTGQQPGMVTASQTIGPVQAPVRSAGFRPAQPLPGRMNLSGPLRTALQDLAAGPVTLASLDAAQATKAANDAITKHGKPSITNPAKVVDARKIAKPQVANLPSKKIATIEPAKLASAPKSTASPSRNLLTATNRIHTTSFFEQMAQRGS